jgi:diguanylate cyclase (GGDEF)-like protein
VQPTDEPLARIAGRSLVTQVLTAQLAITSLIGVIALVGLAWTAGGVIRNNLAHWAGQWAAELNEFGAPFYLRDDGEALLGIERFVAKYPEIERVSWYRADGAAAMSLDETGIVPPGAAHLAAAVVRELAAKAGGVEPYVITQDGAARGRFRLSSAIWTEALPGDGLFAFDPAGETSIELLGFVTVDLDFRAYESAFLPRLALASAVLLLLLGASWAGGRWFLKRSLAPLSQLQQPLLRIAEGDTQVSLPATRYRELNAIVTAIDHTVQSLQKRERRLLHLATHDPLTGLPNRHLLIAELEALQAPGGEKRRAALLFIDLDQFKYVNDTCGHAAGDHLLHLAAQQIRYAVRTEDLVARFGGDEFIVLLRDVARNEAKRIALQVLEFMRGLKHVEQEQVFHLQCSIGIATVNGARYSPHELIAQADIACQAAKAHGRNRAEIYSVAGKQSEQMAKDVEWTRTIRDALEHDKFVLHFQPLLHVRTGTVTHYEALLRLATDDGLVGPQDLLPAAARFGLMADIDGWVLERAVRALAEFGRDDPQLRVSINLSGFAFEDDGLGARVRALLKQHDVAGDRIVLEITEQLAVRFAGNTDKQIALLRDLGCKIAVDDFGTGYSSFSYLKRLPVDYLKIDGSFIKGLARDRVDQSMVRMVGEVAKAAGIQTVAEYVQSAAALTLLAKYGIDYAQGYFVGRPTPAPGPPAAAALTALRAINC